MKPRLWVTGLGLVTPLGAGVEATWSGLIEGRSAIGPVRLFDAHGQRVGRAAEVDGVEVPGEPRGAWSRTSAMALAAATEAMATARLTTAGASVGLVVGGTTGGMFETELLLARLHAQPGFGGEPVELLSHPLTATGDRLEERLGPFARVRAVSSACSSGANAIVVAAAWLLSGEVDAVVAGGADGLCRLTLSGFNALAAVDPDTCRPFDRRRRGTILGEGAGFVVLERAERARARGASGIAELSGWAVGSEAHHITQPAPDGRAMASVIGRAMARAGLSPRDVDYIHAHGTGTPANDAMEAAAIAHAFGGETARIPVSSSKGQIGHTLGAAGGIEAAITALVVARRILVPTVGLDEPDAALGLVHVPHVGRSVSRVRAALSNAFGFGGMGTVLVFVDPADTPAASRSPGPAGEAASHRSAPERERPTPSGPEDRTENAQVGPVLTGVSLAAAPPGDRRLALVGRDGCAAVLRASAERSGIGLAPHGGLREESRPDLDDGLDAERARRLDRTARLAAVVVQRALEDAAASAREAGVVLGSAFGNVDSCAAFMHRVSTKGARAASPAEFPNLVPSSPAGHVSIYAGMHGPALVTADLMTSGESAFAQAVQLVRMGDAVRVVACASEPRSDVVERVLGALFDSSPPRDAPPEKPARRRDLAAAVAVESDAEARARGVRPLARVEQILEWRGDGAAAALEIRAPGGDRPAVICAREARATDDLVSKTPWRAAARWSCSAALGESEALGAAALCAAAARLGAGDASDVLVVGLARGRGYAIVLAVP